MGELTEQQRQPDFWENRERAQALAQELAEYQKELEFFNGFETKLQDASELLALAAGEHDSQTLADLEAEASELDTTLQSKERQLRFTGPHDRAPAIITIQAGAGGTDAQDWAEMLERMYLRHAESQHWPTKSLDRSLGEEAGIKHTTFLITGSYAYGTLKHEHGVHRLVRLSPYNADSLRQTSFARVEILPKISAEQAPIDPKDIQIDTFRASGAGGQHVNKTSSAVRVRHLPTGIVVTCQNERSQGQNKEQALSVLRAKLQSLAEQQHAKTLSDIKGETKEAAWGNQIRSYVLHPYTMVKDHRTKVETSNVQAVLNGDLSPFIA